jgi:ketosteroid isomerase-like protein
VPADNVAIVERLYQAFDAHDTAAIQELFAPDVEIRQTADLPWGGHFHGHEGVWAFFLKLIENVDSQLVREHLFAAGDHVVQSGRTRGTVVATGAAFDVAEVHLWELRDGLVVRYDAYIDTPAMLEALRRT